MKKPLASAPSRRAPLIGAALALTVGLTAGAFLKSGELFNTTAPAAAAAEVSPEDGAITFMTDAGGRVPDYVVGTDVTAGPSEAQLQPVAYEPSQAELSVNDWSTAPPSIDGDILAMGEAPTSRSSTSSFSTPSVSDHAIDASEVAASGATGRAERAAPTEAAPELSAADRRDGQAALAAAGFSTN